MTPTTFGVRDAQFKLIRYHGIWDRNEFYDLKDDPYEINNLIESKVHQKKIIQMTEALYSGLKN